MQTLTERIAAAAPVVNANKAEDYRRAVWNFQRRAGLAVLLLLALICAALIVLGMGI